MLGRSEHSPKSRWRAYSALQTPAGGTGLAAHRFNSPKNREGKKVLGKAAAGFGPSTVVKVKIR